MRILAVDTATRSCGIAVLEEGTVLAETLLGKGRTHSQHLMQLIDSTLALTGFTIADIDGLAVTQGPGSFTGLRIGISTMKGIAYASGKPLVGVSSLDALAFQFSYADGWVCPLLDARKHEIYYAIYQFKAGRLVHKSVEAVVDVHTMLESIDASCLFMGDGAVVYKKEIDAHLGHLAQFAPPVLNLIKAGWVGELGWRRLEDHQVDPVESFVPFYIRKSDAELGPRKK